MRFDGHTHTHKSNWGFRDSTNFETDLIDKAIELGLKGIAITDHAVLSSHVTALNHIKKLRENEIGKDFKLGLGIEIYLVDREEIKKARLNNVYTRFYHLVVIAKNKRGYEGLKELSTFSWKDSFFFRGMQRVPTYKDYFDEWSKKYKGDIIITTACLGSEFSKLVLNYIEDNSMINNKKIYDFLYWLYNLYGEDFYIEIQPSIVSNDQIKYNKLAIEIAKYYNIKVVINTDSHYLTKDKKEIHSNYLKSQDVERETSEFYSSTYLMDNNELREYFDYLSDEEFNSFINNSLEMSDKIEDYDLYKSTLVPTPTLNFEPDKVSILAPLVLNTDKYEYIIKYGTSEYIEDKLLLQTIEKGLIDKKIIINDEILNRLNLELKALWLISEKLNQRLSSYYLLTKEVVELTWEVSLVGVSRGSAGAFYICYLLDIIQINPLKFNIPYWRHISETRPELPDIDIDSEAGQRSNIIELVKKKYGENRVINICTFKTEGTSSAIQTACRGMNIKLEDSQYLSNLRVKELSVKEALEQYDNNKEAKLFINEIMKHEGLLDNILDIEGLCCGRSIHASGVYIYPENYWNYNSLMKSPNGNDITQFDMASSDYMGGLKIDFLTIEALDKIDKCLKLMIEDNLIEDKGSLRKTYNYYLHPDVLEMNDKSMWDSLCNNEIIDAFQMDSDISRATLSKVKAHSFREICDVNSLTRISVSEGKQPVDRYYENKIDINNWYNEMRENGLNDEEINVMKKHLLDSYGVASTQEQAMLLSMDKKIAGFDLVEANKLRKAIAKSYAKDLIKKIKENFMAKGKKLGNREEILNYVWNLCIVPMLGYSFSIPHIYGYSLILVQEMNLYKISDLHWKTACLCIGAGDINEDLFKNTDYGKLSKSIERMGKGFVKSPSINKSKLGFKPLIDERKALFGLGAINGISGEVAKKIIELRPYKSFEDFLERIVKTKIVKKSSVYNLIKGGCFDEFESDRFVLMKRYLNFICPDKTGLTMSNVPKLIQYGIIDENYKKEIDLFYFKTSVFSKENMIDKNNYLLRPENKDYLNKNIDIFINCVNYDDNGNEVINKKIFDKIYIEKMDSLKKFISDKNTLNKLNNYEKALVWDKYCSGQLPKWEMDSLSYYSDEHELDSFNISDYISLSKFNELPEYPKTILKEDKRGFIRAKKELSIIAGTVVDKNKDKRIVYLYTQYGVVSVKLNKSSFAYYNKKGKFEKGWFERGTKLAIVGYRNKEYFYPKIYSDSIYSSSVLKIKEIKGKILLESEKEE